MTFHAKDRSQNVRLLYTSFLFAACVVQMSWSFMSFDDEAEDLVYDDGDDIEYRDLDTLYHGNVSKGNPERFVFLIEDGMNMSAAIRIHVSSSNARKTEPIIFFVKQHEGVMTWQVPQEVVNQNECEFQYESVARTLCLFQFDDEDISEVVIDVSCSSTDSTSYSLKATVVYEFDLEMSSPLSVTISPSQPQYYYFRFPNGVDSVQVRGHSEDKICSVIAVQEVGCPVFDLLRNVEFIGKFQTQTTQSSITVQAKDFRSREFFVVLLAHPDDSTCNRKTQCKSTVNENKVNDVYYQTASSTSSVHEVRLKNVTLEIIPTKPSSVYLTGIMVAMSLFLCPYIAFLIVFLLYRKRRKDGQNTGTQTDNGDDKKKEDMLYSLYFIPVAIFYVLPVIQLVFTDQMTPNYTGKNEEKCYFNFMCANSLAQLSAFNSVFSNIGYIFVGILYLFIVRWKDKLTSDKGLKDKGIKKYYGLHYTLGSALIMEGILNGSYHICPNGSNYQFGTTNICMYIMVCITTLKLFQNRHPGELASAFITYTCLAVLDIVAFLGLVFGTCSAFWNILIFVHIGMSGIVTWLYYKHDKGHGSCSDASTSATQNGEENQMPVGATQNGEVNQMPVRATQNGQVNQMPVGATQNGQVNQMHVGATQNGDENQTNVCPECRRSVPVNEINASTGATQNSNENQTPVCPECRRSMRMKGIIGKGQTMLIVVVNLFNLSTAIAAAIVQPEDFETYLLGILVVNSGFYFLFYIIMKVVLWEHWTVPPILCAIVAFCLWVPAWISLSQGLTRWETTPAISREGNRDCSWFDFYDYHDMWHFLSAGALFFTFLTLLSIDDGLDKVKRDSIGKF